MASSQPVLFIDAYDSFSQNIVALLHQELGVQTTVINIDTNIKDTFGIPLETLVARFDAIVLGPGPGNPNNHQDVGLLYDVFDAAAIENVPVLGICLGFQTLCVKYGLRVSRLRQPCHGHAKTISIISTETTEELDDNLFDGIGTNDLHATCYNSLGLTLTDALRSPNHSRPGSSGTNASFSTSSSQENVNSQPHLRVLATDQERNVMIIRHNSLPFWGTQFHPESCKSNRSCRQLIRNWWRIVEQRKSKSISSRREESRPEHLYNTLTSSATSFKIPTSATRLASSVTTHLILTQLLKISATTGKVVNWESVDANCNRRQLSELIHDFCATGHVAMLESTRKGRFSVYAFLAEDRQPVQQHTPKISAPFCSWQAQYHQSEFSIITSRSEDNFWTTASREEIWDALTVFMTQKRASGGPHEIPFWGGFLGFLSYEHGLDTLEVQPSGPPIRSVPEMSLVWVERSIVYDNLTNKIYILTTRQNDQLFVAEFAALLSMQSNMWERPHDQSSNCNSQLRDLLDTAEISLPNREQYYSQFYQCQSELHAGNSYELCLTTEATITIPKSLSAASYEFELYKNLHSHNPVPFGAFLKFPGITIIGTSPEQYMSWSRYGTIDMIPMKGTVKRSPEMTFERASEILSSAKESAENLMIADLIRHDLYTAVGHKSRVEVMKLCEVIEHETVYQLVSHIRAHAPINQDLSEEEKKVQAIQYGLKTLQQTIPPGSMTGAPKKRSCEILSQLEQRNRGLYSGVLGYMDVGGGGSWSVCIRTAFRCDNDKVDQDVWHLGAGGAITVLSDAEGEWQEMMVKLNSVLKGFQNVKDEQEF